MVQLDFSISGIITIAASGLLVYVIAPLFFVGRDLLLHKIIEKWVITSKLMFDIGVCETDRWFLEKSYKKKRKKEFPVSGGEVVYKLDNECVSRQEYERYEEGLALHLNRFNRLNPKIGLRHNLILWLTHHYRLNDLKSPIPEMRDDAYSRAELDHA